MEVRVILSNGDFDRYPADEGVHVDFEISPNGDLIVLKVVGRGSEFGPFNRRLCAYASGRWRQVFII